MPIIDVLTAVLNVMAFVIAAHTFYAVLGTLRLFSEDVPNRFPGS